MDILCWLCGGACFFLLFLHSISDMMLAPLEPESEWK